mmetsp:Transcript_117488/g.262563  ORF Transcript_117488/g.262563 Transcript_117488/m.262563 type:complete len:328 (-) Transcript_117488:419-1402(-)
MEVFSVFFLRAACTLSTWLCQALKMTEISRPEDAANCFSSACMVRCRASAARSAASSWRLCAIASRHVFTIWANNALWEPRAIRRALAMLLSFLNLDTRPLSAMACHLSMHEALSFRPEIRKDFSTAANVRSRCHAVNCAKELAAEPERNARRHAARTSALKARSRWAAVRLANAKFFSLAAWCCFEAAATPRQARRHASREAPRSTDTTSKRARAITLLCRSSLRLFRNLSSASWRSRCSLEMRPQARKQQQRRSASALEDMASVPAIVLLCCRDAFTLSRQRSAQHAKSCKSAREKDTWHCFTTLARVILIAVEAHAFSSISSLS